MSFETYKISIPLWYRLIAGILVVIVISLYFYFTIDSSETKLVGFVGGIVTGLIVYLATFFTLLRPLQELDRFRQMRVKALLANRHDQNYYRKLVATSTQRVDVMGASCGRFVQDFLDIESEDKVLVDALSKHRQLRVRLLIPDDDHMSEEGQTRKRFTLCKLAALKERFGDRVELRRFSDKAHHSFVLVDNDLIAGPIFKDDKSRYAPAVHVAAETVFGQKYSAHFDAVWNVSRANV